jgi:glyoxylase-like metal-dependent hydrolase (beta-lactamase superfamily II)
MSENELVVFQFPNKSTGSNSYIIRQSEPLDCCLIIDIGEYVELRKELLNFRSAILLLTHTHYDHILFIEELVQDLPHLQIWVSSQSAVNLASSKKNLSFYHDYPIEFYGDQIKVTEDKDNEAFIAGFCISIYRTPGHTPGCLSFCIGNYLFTGDALIPGIPVVTKLPGGDKEESAFSKQKLEEIITPNTLICPGHGPVVLGESYFSGTFSLNWNG